MQWRALEQPPQRQPRPAKRSVHFNGLGRIVGTTGREPTSAGAERDHRQQRRDRPLVNTNHRLQEQRRRPRQRRTTPARPVRNVGRMLNGGRHLGCGIVAVEIWRHASMNFFCSSGTGDSFTAARAMRSKSQSRGSWDWWWRYTSRKRRLARLRWVAPPTAAFDAMTQTRLESRTLSAFSAVLRRFHQIVNARQSIRRPCSRTSRMSRARRRCCSGGKRMAARDVHGSAAQSNNRQPFTPLATARFNDFAAAGRGHAGAVTNLAGSFLAVRAECRLHVVSRKRGSEVPHGMEGVKEDYQRGRHGNQGRPATGGGPSARR